MRILVHLRQILDPAGVAVNRRAGRVFVNREEYILNPADRNALEIALQLKDALPAGTEVIALAAGPERCAEVLRNALATGVDRAVRLADPGPQGDGAALAHVLAAAARALGAWDLVLTGDRALDAGQVELGATAARALDVPLAEHVCGLRAAEGLAHVVVPVDNGYVEMGVPLPAVVTVVRDANKPRLAYAPRLISAFAETDVEYWDAGRLGLTPEDLAPRVARGEAEAPPEIEAGRIASNVSEVVAALKPYLKAR